MTPTPPARPLLDQDLHALLAVVCEQDRGENPFGWSAPAPPPLTPAGAGRGEDRR